MGGAAHPSAQHLVFLLCALALTWVVIHGLGDTTPLFGDFGLIWAIGLAVALVALPAAKRTDDEADTTKPPCSLCEENE